jgi:hypothetical protein
MVIDDEKWVEIVGKNVYLAIKPQQLIGKHRCLPIQ